jgi:GNAT superfamily N-acetyltransferase
MPHAPPDIRPLAREDEAEWRALWAQYLAFYEHEAPEEVYRTTFARLLSGDPTEPHGLVATRDGRIIGLAHYIYCRTCWKIERTCYLQDLFTSPDVRGPGVARALIHAVYAAADAPGNPAVWWLTQEHNYRGRLLYDQVAVKTAFIRYNRAP